MATQYKRSLPRLDDENRYFWTSGEDGVLRILRCQGCGQWIHPPSPVCPNCLGGEIAPEATSGTGVVETFTVNERAWGPGMEVPYVIAIVVLDEQPDLRLTTNIRGIPAHDVRIGQRVRVEFEHDEDVWLPMFGPADA